MMSRWNRKLWALILAAGMTVSLAACGGNDNRDDLFVENGVSGCSDGSRANAVQSRYTVVEL